MSQDLLTLDPRQLELLAQEVTDTEASSGTGVQMISTRGGRMTLKGMPIVGDKVIAVILTSPIERNYYEGAFDSAAAGPPDCSAIGYDSEIKPAPNALKPQHTQCFGCPKNEWGSSTQGSRKGKACKETRKIIFIDIDTITAVDQIATAPIYGIRPPVTSVTAYSTYVKQMSTTLKKPPFAYVTEISVVPDNKNQFRTEFKFIREIAEPAMLFAIMDRAKREKEVLLNNQGFQLEADETPVDEVTVF